MFVDVQVSSIDACEGNILTVFDGEVVDSCADLIPSKDTYSCSEICMPPTYSLRWRHNDHAGVSNHQPHGCLINRLFRRQSKKTSKLRVTGLCVGNSPGTGEFPAQMASYAENVSIWWRHHVSNGFLPPTTWPWPSLVTEGSSIKALKSNTNISTR